MKKKSFIVSTIPIVLAFVYSAFATEILGVYFPPYKDAHIPIIKLYDNAEKYIHLSIYSLTKDEFAEAYIFDK